MSLEDGPGAAFATTTAIPLPTTRRPAPRRSASRPVISRNKAPPVVEQRLAHRADE